jgi:hypothetical protein
MFVIQFYNTGSNRWERSGNTQSSGTYTTTEEAQAVVNSEENESGPQGLRYRYVSAPTALELELNRLRDKISRIKYLLDTED